MDVLAEKRRLVWQTIKPYLDHPLNLPKYMAIDPRYRDEVAFHWQMVREYPQRQGKYVRPTLLLLTAEAMGFPLAKALRTAAAMQVSEDWLLIHDDVEDDSLQRRGKPALHRIYGRNLAFNAGDGLHFLMWAILVDNVKFLGFKKGLAIMDEFVQMLTRTCLGQTVEIRWTEENRWDLGDEDYFFIVDGKTVYYTIAGPMRLGAILAGANAAQLQALYEFGRPLGRCFQIRDDLLDLTSDFAGLKKQQGNDIYEGKRTLMLFHLWRTIKGPEKKRLAAIMSKPRAQKTAAEVAWVIKMMAKWGSLEYGEQVARRLAEEAREIFRQKLGFLKKQPARRHLEMAIDFILERKY